MQSSRISTLPGLFPAFDPSVTDYVTRCQPFDQVRVSGSAPRGGYVIVDRGAEQTGHFTQSVDLSAGQEFEIASTESGTTMTYYVRCLPSDFPTFTADVSGPRQAAFYIVSPHRYPTPAGFSDQYTAFFDNNGVPVWWMKSSGTSIPEDSTLLPDGNVIWTHALAVGTAGAEEHALDGTLVRTINTVGSEADLHDVQMLPNGDYLMGTTFRNGLGTTECGGSPTGELLDFELQEFDG